MAPRLSGRTLRITRALTARGPLSALARRLAIRDSGLDAIAALPPEDRSGFDVDARPLAGAPPRRWGTDVSPGGRGDCAEVVEDYASGRRLPCEVLDALEARIAVGDVGECLHSPYVALVGDRARVDAEAATARYRAGTPGSPLDGVPVCIKDHHDVAGLPTRGGTRLFDEPAAADSQLVARLRAAGAIVYGKTHTTEWGLAPTGVNPHFCMPRNPYDRSRAAGGSSTGTAVAIALGHAPCGIGSDGGGSVRIPAALSGVFGLKPSFLRIGRTGDLWSAGTCGTNGVLGARAADCAALLACASGRDEADPATWNAPPGDPAPAWRAALGRGVRGCRIGVWRWALEAATPHVARACEEALRVLEGDGAQLVEIEVPLARHHLALGVAAIGVETAGMLGDVLAHHGTRTGDDVRLQCQLLAGLGVEDYFLACRTRAVLRRRVAATIAELDVIAAPTTLVQAPVYLPEEDGVPILDGEAVRGLCTTAFLANLTGLPAGSVPVGMRAGLPVGLQIIGDAWDEASVLAVMAHCERTGITAMPRPVGYAPP